MAKKIRVADPGSGHSAREVMAHAIGKKPADLTLDDVKSWVGKQGLAPRDQRQVIKGAEHFFNSGDEYRLKSGGYDVVERGGGVKGTSSRQAGNKKGFNPGDLVGLGDNVSKFMGLVNKHTAAYASRDSGSGKKEDVVTSNEPEAKNIPVTKSEPVKAAVKSSAKASGSKTSSPAAGSVPESVSTASVAGGPKQLTGEELMKGWLDRANKPNDGKGKELAGRGKDLGNRLLGGVHGTTEWTFGKLADLAEAFGTPKSEQGLFKPIQDEAAKYEKIRKEDTNPNFDPSLEHPLSAVAELLPGTLASGPLFKTAGMVGSKVLSKIPGGKYLKKGSEYLGKKISSKFTGAAAGTTAKQYGQATAKVAGKKVTDVAKKVNVVSKDIKFPQMQTKPKIKVQGEVVKPREKELVEFRKGGKLNPKSLVTGPTRHPREAGDAKIGYKEGGRLGNPGRIVWGATQGALSPLNGGKVGKFDKGGLFDDVDLVPGSKKVQLNNDTPGNYDMAKTDNTGNYGFKEAKTAKTKNEFAESPLAGILNKAKYVLPFIGEGAARKTLEGFKATPAKAADLMTGVVTDMPKPNFHLRYRQPVGPDMQSEQTGQKFADAQLKEKEADFATQNAASRIAQQRAIVQQKNQNEMFNTQQENMANIYNNQLKAGMTGAISDTYRQPFLAAQHMLNTDISNASFINEDKKRSLAEEIIKNPDRYGGMDSDRVKNAYNYMAGRNPIKGRNGMKFKSKFATC